MPTINLAPYEPTNGTLTDANAMTTALQTIQTAVNGLDDTNIAANAAIALSKLAQGGATSGQTLTWDSVSSSWKPGGAPFVSTTLIDEVSTATETDWLGSQGSGYTVPANTLAASSDLIVDISGDLKVVNAGTPTQQIRVYLGGTKYIDSGASNFSASNGVVVPWQMIIRLRMVGATNSVLIETTWSIWNPGAGTGPTTGYGTANFTTSSVPFIWSSAGPQTVDMTVAQALRVTHTWGTSSPSSEVRVRKALVYRRN